MCLLTQAMPPFIVLADGPHLYEVPVVSYFNPLCVHQSSSLYIRVTYLILQERDVSTLHFAVTMQNSLIISDFLLHFVFQSVWVTSNKYGRCLFLSAITMCRGQTSFLLATHSIFRLFVVALCHLCPKFVASQNQ